MKHLPTALILAAFLTAAAGAEDTTALQVAPSDTVVYPDASQILNKTEPKAKAAVAAPTTAAAPTAAPAAGSSPGLPSAKPLLTSTPVPAAKAPAASASAARPLTGWFVRWTFATEADARTWAETSGRAVAFRQTSAGKWEALQGPLDAGSLKAALEGQSGLAALVRLSTPSKP